MLAEEWNRGLGGGGPSPASGHCTISRLRGKQSK